MNRASWNQISANAPLTEAAQTDLSSPNPSRRRRPYGRPSLGRLALRLAVLVVAVSALGAAYWFTQPPELVWWRSPPVSKTARHLRLLVPIGWKGTETTQNVSDPSGRWIFSYEFVPEDRRPAFFRRLLSRTVEDAHLMITIRKTDLIEQYYEEQAQRLHFKIEPTKAIASVRSTVSLDMNHGPLRRDVEINARLVYYRSNFPAFNRTYRQICNSLRIE